MKRMAIVLSTLIVLALLTTLAVPVDYKVSGWHALVDRWRPEIEVTGRVTDATIGVGVGGGAKYSRLVFVPAAAPLSTPTTFATDNECLHPDVVYAPRGWGAGDKKWWMVMTPLSQAMANYTDYEYPEILCADEPGGAWAVPSGLTNPIDSTGSAVRMPDPCLMLDNGVMYCYYPMASGSNTLVLCKASSDGVTWGTRTTVLSLVTATENAAAPSVQNIDGTYYMWVTDSVATPDKMVYRTASSPMGPWSSASDVTLNGIAGGGAPWHGSVKRWGDKFYLILSAVDDLYFGVSDGELGDGSFTFDCERVYTGTVGAWDETAQYQSCLAFYPQERRFDVFYSCWDENAPNQTYYIGLGRLYLLPNADYDLSPLNRMVKILGDVRGFWPFLNPSGTTVQDYSRYDHDLTPSKNIGAWDTVPELRLPIHILAFDGVDEELDLADDDDFSFTDDADDDYAFSCGAWINLVASDASQVIMGKYDYDTKREWVLFLNSAEQLIGYIADESANAVEGRKDASTMTAGVWTLVVMTYDGRQGDDAKDGMDLYVLTPTTTTVVAVDDTAVDVGTYAGMENLAVTFQLGHQLAAGSADGFWASEMAMPFVRLGALTTDEIWQLYLIGREILGY